MGNDEQIPGILAGRPIYWCPGGNGKSTFQICDTFRKTIALRLILGYPPYCPRPTDSDEYTYCCTYGYEISMPTCCRYPFHTGMLYAFILSTFVFAAGNLLPNTCRGSISETKCFLICIFFKKNQHVLPVSSPFPSGPFSPPLLSYCTPFTTYERADLGHEPAVMHSI